jgi:hypothetical protein
MLTATNAEARRSAIPLTLEGSDDGHQRKRR